jgi:hypothetical protein
LEKRARTTNLTSEAKLSEVHKHGTPCAVLRKIACKGMAVPLHGEEQKWHHANGEGSK